VKPASLTSADYTDSEAFCHNKPLVLLVDDDVASLMLAEGPLVDAGFQVVQAKDGIEAIAQFEEHKPDIIVMDAVMPKMDGFDAIAKIRNTKLGTHVPILMTTGLDDLDSITRAYDEGATDFLTKPINFFILPYRVQYMLRSKETADELRSSQSRLDNAQRIARLGHWEWDVKSDTANWSVEVARMFGFDKRLLYGSMESLFSKVNPCSQKEVRLHTELAVESAKSISLEFDISGLRENDIRSVRLEAEPKIDDDGNCTHMLGTVQDVTESANAQKQIHDLAYYDLVTGLPNRAQMRENLSKALRLAERQDNQLALLFLDLDHFKQVNDTLGHDAGDDLLRQVSDRLATVLRESDTLSLPEDKQAMDFASNDTVARIGGDEFVVLLGCIGRPEDAARVAERIAEAVRSPYLIADVEVSVTSTIGISVYPADGRDSETLMKHADVAMYHAKENGRNGFQFYSTDIHEYALSRFSLERELKHAIVEKQLSLLYQPKLDMLTGRTVGVEALARWNHPERGAVSPSDFIPLAEETGLIMPLGRWVLNEAAHRVQEWNAQGLGEFSVAVNCSPAQFTKGNMVRDIEDAIKNNGISPGLLEIELTENLFLHDIENGIQLLAGLKELGVKIAIDDFGTGVSSLSYLKRLPVDKLKIDRVFVKELHEDKGDEAIVSAIVTLGHRLGLSIVAEGVEKEEQLTILRKLKCDEIQGFYFCSPLSHSEFAHWVEDQQGPLVQTGTG